MRYINLHLPLPFLPLKLSLFLDDQYIAVFFDIGIPRISSHGYVGLYAAPQSYLRRRLVRRGAIIIHRPIIERIRAVAFMWKRQRGNGPQNFDEFCVAPAYCIIS